MDDDRTVLYDRFEREMLEGYLDGRRPDNPEPGLNRSRSYRHGFANGRDDHARSPRALAQTLRDLAEEAIGADIEESLGQSVVGGAMPTRPQRSDIAKKGECDEVRRFQERISGRRLRRSGRRWSVVSLSTQARD